MSKPKDPVALMQLIAAVWHEAEAQGLEFSDVKDAMQFFEEEYATPNRMHMAEFGCDVPFS